MVAKVDQRPTLKIRRGVAKTFSFTVTNTSGTARDMTGETLLFSCSLEIGDAAPFLTKTMDGSESGSTFASGIAACNFVATDFASLSIQEGEFSTFLAWSLTLTTSGGTKYAVTIDGYGAALLEVEQAA